MLIQNTANIYGSCGNLEPRSQKSKKEFPKASRRVLPCGAPQRKYIENTWGQVHLTLRTLDFMTFDFTTLDSIDYDT